MTIIITATNSVAITLAANENYLLTRGVTHYTDPGTPLTASGNNSITVLGDLVGFTSTVISGGDESGTEIFVGPDGSIIGSAGYYTIRNIGDGGLITNYGVISGGRPFDMTGDDISVINHGQMSMPYNDFFGALGASSGENVSITNTGSMVSNSTYLLINNNISDASTYTVVNSGEMFSDFYGIFSLSGSFGRTFFRNTGLLDAQSVAYYGGAGFDEIHNSGEIHGSVSTVEGADTIWNSGLINGNISLGDGTDRFTTRGDGVVSGSVDGGTGNDTLSGGSDIDQFIGGYGDDLLKGRGGDDNLDAGADNDVIYGGKGDDDITGGTGADTVFGGGDSDTVNGGDGNDSIRGDGGDDSLNGGADNDTIKGGAGDDTIIGDTGFDTLFGQKGNDVIDGGGRSDVINGGAGDDTLTGGGGADTFVFNRKAGDDEITDFQDGLDQIDLSDFNLQNFNALQSSGAISNLSGGGIVIDLSLIGGEGSITITGTLVAGDFSSADFIF